MVEGEKQAQVAQKISTLKNDIQNILDKIGQSSDTESLELEKADKIKELCLLTEIQKNMENKKECDKRKIDIQKVGRTIDSLEFSASRKKGIDGVEKAKANKLLREKVRNDFFALLEKERQFDETDPEDVPGRLFLHTLILDAYGMCPFLVCENMNKEQLRTKRMNWLSKQMDKGETFWSLFRNIYEQESVNAMSNDLDSLENDIMAFIMSRCTNEQWERFEKMTNFVVEYLSQPIKTKRLKESYKQFINELSIFYSEIKLPINDYLKLKYKLDVFVNDKVSDTTTCKADLELFNQKIEAYKTMMDEHDQKVRCVTNTMKNIKNSFYDLLKKLEDNHKKNEGGCFIEGKYFRKWSDLTIEEKKDRLGCYAKFKSHQLEHIECESQLQELLFQLLISKKLPFKNVTWNVSKGLITDIKGFVYDDSTKCFQWKDDKESVKRVSKTDKFDKQAEKLINGFVLDYIVKNSLDSGSELTTITKNDCLDKIKLKLRLKKIGKNQKMFILNKINEILMIVSTDPYDPSND
jgi:hypothetical protein